MPPDLAARAVLAYSDPGDLVLDPDCASGSVLVEAIRHGRRAIGLTTDPQQGALAIANISHARQQGAPARAAVLEGHPQQLPSLLRKARPILNANTRAAAVRHPAGSVRLILTSPPIDNLAELLPGLRSSLAPGGFLLLALDHRPSDTPVGLGAIVATVEQSELEYWQHVIALRTTRRPAALLLHTDVLAFRKPSLARSRPAATQAASA